jgi:hypothetical protein
LVQTIQRPSNERSLRDAFNALLLVVVLQTNTNYQMSASPPSDAFPMDGFPFPFVREFIDANGGEVAFEG